MKIIVSACLLGDNVKYNGLNNKNKELIEYLKDFEIIKICPEVLGGLPIPRNPSEIRAGKVFNNKDIDVTDFFTNGALKILEIVKKENIKIAILKDGSPSCGNTYIYDGTFSQKKINGLGITSKLLRENGVIIFNENNYNELNKFMTK